MKTRSTPIEILEARIAPAQTYFVSGAAGLLIHDNANMPVDGDTDAAMFAGANKALPLTDGDTVVYDLNGDGIKNAGDVTLIKIMKGKATAFFNDLNANMKFDLSEFTGLALGDAVKGTVTAVINGDVATVLKTDGSLPHSGGDPFALQQAGIDGLKITGRVTGNVFAGTGVKNFSVLAPAFSRQSDPSIGNQLAVGATANGEAVQFDGATSTALANFAPAPGAAGGDIIKVHLANGAKMITAGNGAGIANGTAGKGGDLIGLTIDSTPGVGDLTIIAGDGGRATTAGTGGAGGRIEALKLKSQSTGKLVVLSGEGGSTADGAGGAGGALLKSTITALREPDQVTVLSGSGTDGGNAGTGGDGGAMIGLTATLSPTKQIVLISTGSAGFGGANGGSGGHGGDLRDCVVRSGGTFGINSMMLSAGAGGGGQGAGGNGGNGGSLHNLTATITGKIAAGGLRIYGGMGGGVLGTGAGGDGGEISKLKAVISGIGGGASAQIYGGHGGDGNGGNGGRGGNLTGATLTNLGEIEGDVALESGRGGNVLSGTGNGGDSGDTSKISLLNLGREHNLGIYGGAAGSAADDGNGGNSGKVSDVTIFSLGQKSGNGYIWVSSGGGGEGGSNTGNGGNSGEITKVKITDLTGNRGLVNNTYLYVGPGGTAPSATGKGGNSGNLSKLTLTGLNSHFAVGSPNSNYGGSGGAGGGNGGDITDVKVAAQLLDVFGFDGGSATVKGNGGNGGNVSKIKVTKITDYVHSIHAGNGGDGQGAANHGGTGGSVTDVKVPGDLGDFRTAFGSAYELTTGMGGLFAGAGGKGAFDGNAGSIAKVSAQRIAAILAGHPTGGALTAANAVTSITAIKASVIGADVDDDRVFDFNNDGGSPTAGFDLGSMDEAIDGLVIVKTGGFTPPAGVVPLKVIPV